MPKRYQLLYLAKGLDLCIGRILRFRAQKILLSVTPNDDFTLTLNFDNGKKRLLDCKPYRKMERFFVPTENLRQF